MLQVQCLESTKVKTTEVFSKFRVAPLAKGQGITVGNTLRRTLLSSIPGIATRAVRILNINHEFSTIPGVREDVVEILLNIKQLVFKGTCENNTFARLTFHGPGILTAGELDLPSGVSLVNSQQYIATVETNETLELEFLLGTGTGYSLTNQETHAILPGFMAVDAVFMPVRKVNFFVESTNEINKAEIESLILEIQTDGSIEPMQALNQAAHILSKLFESFNPSISDAKEIVAASRIDPHKEEKSDLDEILIEELELSVRAYNCLKRANIHTLGDLLQYEKDELLEFKNFGRKSADEVCESLTKRFNITLI